MITKWISAAVVSMALMATVVTPKPAGQTPIEGLAAIPAGSFEMGDHHGFVDPQHPSDEIPIHRVRLDAFYMGIYDEGILRVSEFGAGAEADFSA